MLVLSRKVGEQIVIGDDITVVVNRIDGNRVSIGIQAPNDVRIVRGELERFDSDQKDKETPISVPAITFSSDSSNYIPRLAR